MMFLFNTMAIYAAKYCIPTGTVPLYNLYLEANSTLESYIILYIYIYVVLCELVSQVLHYSPAPGYKIRLSTISVFAPIQLRKKGA